MLRHFTGEAHTKPLVFSVRDDGRAPFTVASNSEGVVLGRLQGFTIATLAPSAQPQRFSIRYAFASPPMVGAMGPTPPLPKKTVGLHWPGTAPASVQLGALAQNGLVLDRIATPDENPWGRRVRAADLAFLTDDRAAVVTYDGDVWLVDGLADPALARLTWRRFASGLHEPLAIVAPRGVIQVATKNGIVRLHDRDGDGEADWFENFSDAMLQSQTTRSFPLDMALGPDGSTYVTQGGIVARSGMPAGGEGTAHAGGIVKISPDGRRAQLFGANAREPYVAVHPQTGVVTATDQQGHYIPSSACYVVRPGDDFGYPELKPAKLTPPLVWVPYSQDTSSASEL